MSSEASDSTALVVSEPTDQVIATIGPASSTMATSKSRTSLRQPRPQSTNMIADSNNPDHSSWQVVLVTSQRKLVLYDRQKNSLRVASTSTLLYDEDEGHQEAGTVATDDSWEEEIHRDFGEDDENHDSIAPRDLPSTSSPTTTTTTTGLRQREYSNGGEGSRTPTLTAQIERVKNVSRSAKGVCPLCRRPLQTTTASNVQLGSSQSFRPSNRARTSGAHHFRNSSDDDETGTIEDEDYDVETHTTPEWNSNLRNTGTKERPIFDLIPGGRRRIKDSSYFALLSHANSRNNSPRVTRVTSLSQSNSDNEREEGSKTTPIEGLSSSTLNTGYFETFFETLQLLGRGGAGSVWLVRHVLNGEGLGLYACKKVAVGDSAPSLLRILREVHLLEAVQHPNIVVYHHAWVESVKLSVYAPSVPTLHILMAYANGGSLSSFVDRRRGASPSPEDCADDTPAQRKERHRLRKLGAVHLLRIDEIVQLARDVTLGLGFLHQRNILHLDLKAENVLLQWEENALLPVAKLSDFGNATSEAYNRERTGGSGTLLYTAPESFDFETRTGRLHSPDRATDQWALGLILHLLSFFALPYHNEEDALLLEEEIKLYPGFFPSDALSLDHGTRHDLPPALLRLISRLVHRSPAERPSCEKVLRALSEIASLDVPIAAQFDSEQTEQLGLVKAEPNIRSQAVLIPPRQRLLSTSSQGSTDGLTSQRTDVMIKHEPGVIEARRNTALGILLAQVSNA